MVKKLFFIFVLSGGLVVMAQEPLGKSTAFLQGTIERFLPETDDNPTTISLSNGIVFDTRAGEPVLPADLAISNYQPNEVGYYIIQFSGPIHEEDTRLLDATGAEVCGYLPNYAYIVKMSEETKTRLSAVNRIGWIGLYQPAYKVSRELDLSRSQLDTAIVVIFAEEAQKPVQDQLIALGGRVLETGENKWHKLIKVAISPLQLTKVAREKAVRWIEPFYEKYGYNAQAQWVLQTFDPGTRRVWDKGLKGQGQIVSTLDSGIRTTHEMFRDPSVSIDNFGDYPNHRKIIAYQKSAYDPDGILTFGDEGGSYYHGTHTGCTVGGNDEPVGGTNTNDGMAPESKIFFIDCGSAQYPGQIIHAASLEYSLSIPYNGNSAGGARIVSNSWGGTSRAYTLDCAEADQTMWDYPDYLVLFSGGNNPPSVYTGNPGNAKNVVTVGATANGFAANTAQGYSSSGPSQDGRIKPTVMAPGDLASAYGASDASYATYSGTSMSCPAVAGTAVLLRQYFTDGWYPTGAKVSANGFTPSAALIKAMLINSVETDFADYPVPHRRVGWGRPAIDNALYFSNEERKLKVIDYTVGLQTGMVLLAKVDVASTTNPFRVTLVWTDYPGAENANPALVNDLNLEVTAPTGDVYLGNIFENNQSKTGGASDTKNVEENVFVNDPASGTWKIRVKANNVPFGPQHFALVMTGSLTSGPMTALSIAQTDVDDAGQVNPDRNPDPGETVTIKLGLLNSGDTDLNGISGTLSTSSSAITLLDNNSSYGTIAKGGQAAGDGFRIAIDTTVADGAKIPFTLSLNQTLLSHAPLGELNFDLKIGTPRYPFADHNIGNVVLTVTEHGSIGFLNVNLQGKGFKYPKSGSNWLYHSSFLAGTGFDYVSDWMYPDNASNDSNCTDWKTTTNPKGQVAIGQDLISDQDSRARFDDSGHRRKKGLQVYQRGFAWEDSPYNDFVILRYKLINTGVSAINGLYAGIMADFDMGVNPQLNNGGVDASRRLGYMKQGSTDNPHVGVKVLDPHQASNVSLLENPVYVYQGANTVWHDSTAFKFLSGTIKETDGSSSTDWSVFVAAGPFNLAAGAEDTVAFVFIAGDNLTDLQANADKAQALYDTIDFIEKPVTTVEEPVRIGSPGFALALGAPTPFRSHTSIAYEVADQGWLTISVYNALGAKVKTLVEGVLEPGSYTAVWNGRDEHQRKLPAGIYFYRMKASGFDKILKTVRVE